MEDTMARIALFILLQFTAYFSFSGEYTFFGPNEYIRHYGEPIKESFTVNTSSNSKEYTLRINNGWGDARQVHAVRIKVNDEVVISPRDIHRGYMDHYIFNNDEWAIEKTGKNGISIKPKDGLITGIEMIHISLINR